MVAQRMGWPDPRKLEGKVRVIETEALFIGTKEHLEAMNKIPPEEIARRQALMIGYARKIADDRSWFCEEPDREKIYIGMASILANLALCLSPAAFAELESGGYDYACVMALKLIDKGYIR
jgi:hypothetical protein